MAVRRPDGLVVDRHRLRTTSSTARSCSRRASAKAGWSATRPGPSPTILDGWSATPPAGIGGRGTEIIDLRSLPTGWNIPDRPDPGWEAAKAKRGAGWADTSGPFPPSYPGGPLGDRPIPYLTGDLVEADGQRVIAGTVVVDAEIPAGETVTAHMSELVAIGSVEARDTATSVAFIGDGTRRVAESFDLYGGRGISVDAPALCGAFGTDPRTALSCRRRSFL